MTRIAFLLILTVFSTAHAEDKRAKITLTPDDLKKAAGDASKQEETKAPEIKVTEARVFLKLGGLKTTSPRRIPIDYPLEEQVIIDLFQKTPPESDLAIDWAPVLKAAQMLTKKQLALLQDDTLNQAECNAKLKQHHTAFEQLFVEAATKKAGKRKVSLVTTRPAAEYVVTVLLDPAKGGRAFYLPVLKYELLKTFGGLNDNLNWYEVGNRNANINGNFHFRGAWNKDTVDTGIIVVDKSRSVRIQKPEQ